MPRVPKQNKKNQRFGGAIWPVEVFLLAAEAVIIYGAGAISGWYPWSYMKKTAVARKRDGEVTRDERGIQVGRVNKQNDGVFKLMVMQSDTKTIKLLDLLHETPHRYRVGFDQDGGLVQMHGLRNAYVNGDWSMEGEEGKARELGDIEINGSPDDAGKPALTIEDVDPLDEATWPATMDDFKTAVVA